MLSGRTVQFLVLLQFVDPTCCPDDRKKREKRSPLYYVTALADPSDYSTHEKQLILAKQLY
jgi:hypothetical protein